LDRIERFFHERQADVHHELCPMIDIGLVALLNERGYHPIELSTVLYRPITPDVHIEGSRNRVIEVTMASLEEEEEWAEIATLGWGEFEEYTEVIHELARLSALRPDALSFFARIGTTPIATGGLSLHAGVALLAGASTLPDARRQGAQSALLEARLRYAAPNRCDLALMAAMPGSASQRNAERNGFRIAYTRTTWQQACPDASG
jgi:GNAT superfamily N-acetyltransferase